MSFADYRFRNSLKRVEEQTQYFPFDKRFFLTERNCLSKDFWRKLKPWFYRRGYGYWAWKSVIVQHYLHHLDDGEILLYCDAGVFWNHTPKALDRFAEYIDLLSEDNGILVFTQPNLEKEWTKGDVLSAIGVYNNEDICNSNQLWGGCFILKKTPYTIKFVDRLVNLCDIEKELITDKRSSIPNKKGFVENRHDQSVFSVLVKTVPHMIIPWQEIQVCNEDWNTLADYPIQARRMKEMEWPLSERIINKLLRPWRDFLGFYFVNIRHYDFAAKRYSW